MDTRFISCFGGPSTHSIRIPNIVEDEENACRTTDESGVMSSFTEIVFLRGTMLSSAFVDAVYVHCPSFGCIWGEGPPSVVSCKFVDVFVEY